MDLKGLRNENGLFAVFEGLGEGGKKTQADMLYRRITNKFVTEIGRDPGTTLFGERTREIMQDPNVEKLLPFLEMLEYVVMRGVYTSEVILPALNSRKVFISQRFSDSTLAYQGYGHGESHDLINKLNYKATLGIVPNITYLIDVPVEEALKNMKNGRSNLLQNKDSDYLERVRKGYLEIARQNRDRYKIISYKPGDKRGMHAEIYEHFDNLLKGFDKRKLASGAEKFGGW